MIAECGGGLALYHQHGRFGGRRILQHYDTQPLLRVKEISRRPVHRGWINPCARSGDDRAGSGV